MPDLNTTNRGHAKRVARLIGASKSPDRGILGGLWHWVNGIANGIGHFIGGPIVSLGRAVLNYAENVVDAFQEYIDAIYRVVFWWDRLVWHTIRRWISQLRTQTNAKIQSATAYLIRLIYVTTNTVLTVALGAVRTEQRRRIRAVAYAQARAKAEIRALHHTIEREAASGYRVGQDDRVSLIVRLLDFAVLRNPALRTIVSDIASGVLDLLSVDDPLARLLLGFLIKHVIDGLGIDKAVGHLISDMLAPLLGEPKPRDIHDIVLDLSKRMLTGESQWTQFFTDGGSEVEQAGKDWRDITGPLGTAAIVAFTVQAVAAPDAWAREISDTIGVVANDVGAKAAALFKGA